MADASQIAEVRENTDERNSEGTWSDPQLGDIIDAAGDVLTASAIIWRRKAAIYADLVDVSEAGASHAFSDLHRSALEMAAQFTSAAGIATGAGSAGRAKVKVIDRAYGE